MLLVVLLLVLLVVVVVVVLLLTTTMAFSSIVPCYILDTSNNSWTDRRGYCCWSHPNQQQTGWQRILVLLLLEELHHWLLGDKWCQPEPLGDNWAACSSSPDVSSQQSSCAALCVSSALLFISTSSTSSSSAGDLLPTTTSVASSSAVLSLVIPASGASSFSLLSSCSCCLSSCPHLSPAVMVVAPTTSSVWFACLLQRWLQYARCSHDLRMMSFSANNSRGSTQEY